VGARSTPATQAAKAAGIAFSLHEYAHDPAAASYATEAAEVLGVDPARVHKTLILQAEGNRHLRPELIVAVVPADASCDLKAISAAVGARKVDLADPTVAQRTTGYVLGGISPLGQRKLLTTVIDEDAQLWDTILVSAGRRGLEIELNPLDLAAALGATFTPVAKR
jgi:Cys-tRNA(Pro)/Cys-tRNA(Cys) deacylase